MKIRTLVLSAALAALSTSALAFQVVGGLSHTVILDDAGTLYTSGASVYGELGHSKPEQGFQPVDGSYTYRYTDAIDKVTLGVTTQGTVRVFGRSYASTPELPITGVKQAVFKSFDIVLLKEDGTVHYFKISSRTVQQVPGLSNITQVEAGARFAVALSSTGSVYTWGTSSYGELGLGDFNPTNTPTKIEGLPPITKVVAAPYHTVLLAADGRAFAYGFNQYGRLATGTADNIPTPTQVLVENVVDIAAGNAQTLLLTADGTVYGAGYTAYQDNTRGIYGTLATPTTVRELTGIKQIFAGVGDQQFMTDGRTVWAMGNSRNKMLDLALNNDALLTRQPAVVSTREWYLLQPTASRVESATVAACAVSEDTAATYATLEAQVSDLRVLAQEYATLKSSRLNRGMIQSEKQHRLHANPQDAQAINQWYVQALAELDAVNALIDTQLEAILSRMGTILLN